MQLDRRRFLFSLAALSAAPPRWLFGATPQEEDSPLTDSEKELLGHLCEQILPRDDFPGARDLAVVDFIDRLLREAHPEWVKIYRFGLKATEAGSRRLHNESFDKLVFQEQTALLEKMEKGELAPEDWAESSQESFFEMVRSHTLHGAYSHPLWGGNRDKKAWEMMGYEDFWV